MFNSKIQSQYSTITMAFNTYASQVGVVLAYRKIGNTFRFYYSSTVEFNNTKISVSVSSNPIIFRLIILFGLNSEQ